VPLRYRIILLLKRFETVIFVTLFILLLSFCLWSLKVPNKNQAFSEEVILNKIDTTDFLKEQEEESWRENNVKLIEIDKNLYHEKSVEEEKVEQSNIDRSSSNDILVQQFPKPKDLDTLEPQTIQKVNPKYVSNKKSKRGTSYSEEFSAFKEKEFGYLTIILENAHEYGYGYVAIDGNLWQQGEYNTTPLKITLPAGNHKVEVKRDGFVSSPKYVNIFIEKNVEKRISFTLIPKKD
jgi:hypothetical protein